MHNIYIEISTDTFVIIIIIGDCSNVRLTGLSSKHGIKLFIAYGLSPRPLLNPSIYTIGLSPRPSYIFSPDKGSM